MGARGEIVDRIAVAVGNRVITESDLDREIRVTAFLDGAKPDFGPRNRRATAERLVDQKLVRKELEVSHYPLPGRADIEPGLRKFKQERFRTDAEYRQALAEYGIDGQAVEDELLWQMTLLRIIEVRFRPGVQVGAQEIQQYFDEVVKPAAVQANPGESPSLDEYRARIEETLAGRRVDKDVEEWLAQARRQAGVVFHDEAFQ